MILFRAVINNESIFGQPEFRACAPVHGVMVGKPDKSQNVKERLDRGADVLPFHWWNQGVEQFVTITQQEVLSVYENLQIG
jgi:hypothetical protein